MPTATRQASVPIGTRVRVWDGTGQDYLGEGSYVGERTVWAVLMSAGKGKPPVILTLPGFDKGPPNPNDLLDHGLTPGVNCEVHKMEHNPAIQLDRDGTLVYGMQCWWHPVLPPETKASLEPYFAALGFIVNGPEFARLPDYDRQMLIEGLAIEMHRIRKPQREALEKLGDVFERTVAAFGAANDLYDAIEAVKRVGLV